MKQSSVHLVLTSLRCTGQKSVFRKIVYLLFYSLTVLSQIEAQVIQEWVQSYRGFLDVTAVPSSMVLDEDGNIYITGGEPGGGLNGSAYSTIKYNSSGVFQWYAIYNGSGGGQDFAHAITVDNQKHVYITGESYEYVGGFDNKRDYVTIKYDSSGNEIWVQKFGDSENDFGTAITTDNSGNVYVTGEYSSGGGTNIDIVTIKYNTAGELQWFSTYDGPANTGDFGVAIAADGSGNVFVAGISVGTTTSLDYAIIKYNPTGQEQWVRRYNGPANGIDSPVAMVIDDQSNVYVTGSIADDSGLPTYGTIKYNTNGDFIWVAVYDFPDNYGDVATDIKVDNSGNVYVTGSSLPGPVTNAEDYATVKYNSAGVEQWVSRYNGPDDDVDVAYSIALDNSNNVYITGKSTGANNNIDYATIKYNSNGDEQWLVRYDGNANDQDEAIAVSLDTQDNVYVVGQSKNSGPSFDITTIKYSQSPSDVSELSSVVPDNFMLSQNYPNPFNPTTKIKFLINESGNVSLKIYDILGNETANLVNEDLSAGTYEVTFDATGLTSGIYLYRLKAGSFVETKKMILLR